MSDSCCASACGSEQTLGDARWRRVLWIALGLNAAMFAVEGVAGFYAGSRALQADALDFLGDAANYAISLGVAGQALAWRARTALVKGVTITLFGFGVLGSALPAVADPAEYEPPPLPVAPVASCPVAVAVLVCATDSPTPGDVVTEGPGVAVSSMRITPPTGRSPTLDHVSVEIAPEVVTVGSTAVGVPPGCGLVTRADPAS